MNKELKDLIERFAENSDRYRRADYNETQVRIDFKKNNHINLKNHIYHSSDN